MMNRKKNDIYSFPILAFFIALLMISCKPTIPDEYIQPGEMEDILYDYHISQAMANQLPNQTKVAYDKSMYYHAVLKKYNVTEAEFDSSLVYYYTHADRMFEIYKNLSKRMGDEAVSLGASVGDINKYSQFKADGDTANIWHHATSVVLMPVAPYNRLDFTIEPDSTFKRGDMFMLNFMTDFIYQSGTKDATVYMAVSYDNDSISTNVIHISTSGMSQLRIDGNTENDIKGIRGFIYLDKGNDVSTTLKLMFIDQIQLIRFHKQKNANGTLVPEKKDSVGNNGGGIKRIETTHSIEEQNRVPANSKPGTPIKMNANTMEQMRESNGAVRRVTRVR